MGHQVSGSDLRERPVLERVRAAGVEVHVGHDRRNVERLHARHLRRRRSQRRTSSSTRPGKSGIAVLSRAGDAVVDLCSGQVARRRRHARQDVDDVDADADPRRRRAATVVHHRWRRHRHGHGCAVDRRRVAGRRGRRERRHASRTAVVRHDPHQRRGRPSRLLRHRDAIVAGFDQYLSRVAGPKVLCIDDPVCAELAARHGAITYGTSPAAEYRAVDVQAEHGAYTFTVVRSGETLGTVDLPLRGVHNVRNALGAWRWRARSASTSTSPPERSPTSAASPGGSRSVASTAARPWSTTMPTCPGDQRGARRGAVAAVTVGSGSSPSSSRIASTAWWCMSPAYRDAFVDADLVVITDISSVMTTRSASTRPRGLPAT